MDRRKIFWVSHLVPYPPKGGVMIRSYNLIKEVARHHDVYLFVINQRKLFRSFYPDQAAGLETVKWELGKYVTVLDIVDEPGGTGRFSKHWMALRSLVGYLPYTVRCFYSQEIKQKIDAQLSICHYDVQHFDTVGLAPYKSRSEIPAIMDHHNVESHMMLRRARKELNPLIKLYYFQEGVRLRKYEQKVLPEFDYHIVCSDDDMVRLEQLNSALNIEEIPNGVPVGAGRPKRTPDTAKPSVLFIGGLTWYPNDDAVQFILSDIWPLVEQNHPTAVLNIIGRNPSKKIKELAQDNPRVKLHGFVDDISTVYEHAALFLCPIRDGGGTKLKILDAMAHGLPVVAHSIGCEGIKATSGTDIVVSDLAESIAEEVLYLLNHPRRAQEIGDAGYNLVISRYNFSSIGEKFSLGIERVCRGAA